MQVTAQQVQVTLGLVDSVVNVVVPGQLSIELNTEIRVMSHVLELYAVDGIWVLQWRFLLGNGQHIALDVVDYIRQNILQINSTKVSFGTIALWVMQNQKIFGYKELSDRKALVSNKQNGRWGSQFPYIRKSTLPYIHK